MTTINFANQGLTGPSTFAAAGPREPLVFTTVTYNNGQIIPETVAITGGVVLGSETNLTAVDRTVYATASQDSDGDPSLSPSIIISFSIPVHDFAVKIFNGLTTPQTYYITVDNLPPDQSDNKSVTLNPNNEPGNFQTVALGKNGNGTFPISTVVISSADSTDWDFSIDNININSISDRSMFDTPVALTAIVQQAVALDYLSAAGNMAPHPSGLANMLYYLQFMGSYIYYQEDEPIIAGIDPFDPNYQQEYTPTFVQLPIIQPDSTLTQQIANDTNTALSDLSKAATYLQAMEVTLNRLNSAEQVGDQASVALQSADLDTWLTLSGSSLTAAGNDLNTLVQDLSGVKLPTVTPQEILNFLTNIENNGFAGLPQQEQALANLFGLSSTDEQSIVNGLLSANVSNAPTSLVNALQQTETAFLGLGSVYAGKSPEAETTLSAVAVEGSMYNAVGTAAEITKLATQFLPPQVANAIQNGFNAQVYACEALGLAFAFDNETGGSAFATNFGPQQGPGMPNTTAGDAAFAAAAASTIFGSAANANTPGAILGFVSNWKAFYTSHGVPGFANPNPVEIDLAARGAAWGDAVGVALANNLGPLPGQVSNFLNDVVQGTAIYSASLASQPPAHAALADTGSQVQLIGAAAPSDHIWNIAPILHVMAGLM